MGVNYLNEDTDVFAPIRKIVVGDPIEGMAIIVGQVYAGYEVVSIERSTFDKAHFFIYAKDKNGVVRLWKEAVNQPMFLEFNQKIEGY